MTHFLSIDVESSGQDMLSNFVVAIGACVLEVARNLVVEPSEDTFLVYLEPPPGTSWDAHCLSRFWNRSKHGEATPLQQLEEQRRQHGVWQAAHGIQQFVFWVRRMAFKYPNLIVISDTASFDFAWIDFYIQRYSPQPRIFPSLSYCTGHYRPPRDITSFFAGLARTLPHPSMSAQRIALTALTTLEENPKARFPDFKVNHDHHPMHDAMLTAHQAAHLTNLLKTKATIS
jgi:hypothetical protein